MSKKCYRYFGGLLNTQAKWLNKIIVNELILKTLFKTNTLYTNSK